MGRGTHNLYTAWTPVGDIDFEQGGLMILEDSPKHVERLRTYLNKDVDTYCVNGPHAQEIETGKRKWGAFGGALGKDPVDLREKLGGRWLSTEFSAGDVLIFSVYTIHASLDNHSRQVRLSSDSSLSTGKRAGGRALGGREPGGPRCRREAGTNMLKGKRVFPAQLFTIHRCILQNHKTYEQQHS